jgi:hypothetical protein
MLQRSMLSRFIVLLSLLLLLGAGSSGAALHTIGADQRAAAQTLPLLWINPTLSLIPIGGTACADVRVEDVEGLFGFETVIRFDHSRVSVVDAYPSSPGIQVLPGPFLQPQNPSNWYVINTADNGSGTIRIAITRMVPESGVSGSGVLATICFLGINRGHTELTLSETATLMLDPQVSFLSFDLKSGGALVGPVYRHRIPLTVRGY